MSPSVRHWFHRTRLSELLVAALLLQALIPAGYMPSVSADGGATLQLCSLDHLFRAAASPDSAAPGSGGSSDPGHATHGWCPFASSLHLPPLNTLITRVVVTDVVLTLPATAILPPLNAVGARTPLPRGPPALS